MWTTSEEGGQFQRRQAEVEAQEEGQGRQAASANVCATWTLGRRWRRLKDELGNFSSRRRFTWLDCLEISGVVVSSEMHSLMPSPNCCRQKWTWELGSLDNRHWQDNWRKIKSHLQVLVLLLRCSWEGQEEGKILAAWPFYSFSWSSQDQRVSALKRFSKWFERNYCFAAIMLQGER